MLAAQWFIFKYDKQASGLAGLAFDEGSFGVFGEHDAFIERNASADGAALTRDELRAGYVTKGVELVGQLESGDTIVAATILSGSDRLITPIAS